jgi:hypothetical protein
MYSKAFENTEITQMGLQSENDSGFLHLGIGLTKARYQISGKTELVIQKLKICMRAGRMNCSIDRRQIIERPSDPIAVDFTRLIACFTVAFGPQIVPT